MFLNLCSIQLISIQPPKILIPIKKYVLWYSKIAKKQKKDTTNNKKQNIGKSTATCPAQQLKNSEPGRRLRLSTYRGRLTRPDDPPGRSQGPNSGVSRG